MIQSATQAKARLKKRLDAGLAAVLARGDSEAADGITTPPPFAILDTEKQSLDGYPTIELIGQNGTKAADSTVDLIKWRIVAAITVAGDDERTITVWSERYTWAIRQFSSDKADLGAEANNPALAGVEFDPVITGNEQFSPIVHGRATGVEFPFVRGAFLELFVTTAE
jgi:hypothetical protein